MLQWVPLIAFQAPCLQLARAFNFCADHTSLQAEVSMLNAIGQLAGTALLCRLLPKVKPPCTYSLLSLRAQIAALKMSMFKQASD